MDNTDKKLMSSVLKQADVYPKALANFIFREIIEDAHVKYNISQEDMKEMCTKAVNRAALFLNIRNDEKLYRGFAIQALGCSEWDDVKITEENEKMLAEFKNFGE